MATLTDLARELTANTPAPRLRSIEAWLMDQAGDNGFLGKMRQDLRSYGRLTERQEAAVRRIHDERAASAWQQHLASLQPAAAPAPVAASIPPGTYTVSTGRDNTWETFRVKPSKNLAYPAQLQLLTGSDNTRSFTSLGELAGGGFRPWSARRWVPGWIDAESADRHLARPEVQAALATLLGNATEEQLAAFGYAYALRSSRCYNCGRKLTVPASIHRGLGPECAGKAAARKAALAAGEAEEDVLPGAVNADGTYVDQDAEHLPF